MPKKYSEEQRFEWLRQLEQGKTEKQIAKSAGCDPRTLRKGIDEARRKRDSQLAHQELVKNALRNHMDSLLAELDNILASLTLPAVDYTVLSWYHGENSVFLPAGESDTEETPAKTYSDSKQIPLDTRTLLKEHLKDDKIWRVLAQWTKEHKAHINARKDLQLKTIEVIQDCTGYPVSDAGDLAQPFVYSYTAGDSLYKAALSKVFGMPQEVTCIEDETVCHSDGSIRYRNQVLIERPNNCDQSRQDIVYALHVLQESPEAKQVLKSYETLETTTARVVSLVREIKLVGILQGRCRICRRLGL